MLLDMLWGLLSQSAKSLFVKIQMCESSYAKQQYLSQRHRALHVAGTRTSSHVYVLAHVLLGMQSSTPFACFSKYCSACQQRMLSR